MYIFLKGGGKDMGNETNNHNDVILKRLEKLGINKESVIATLETDLSRPSSYGKTYLFALDDSLCIFREDGTFALKNYKDITDVYTDIYVSSGSLILAEGEKLFAVADFTLSVSARVEWFVNILRKLIAGEKPNTEESAIKKNADFEYINSGRKKLFMRVLSYVPRYKKHLIAMMSIIIFSTTFYTSKITKERKVKPYIYHYSLKVLLIK